MRQFCSFFFVKKTILLPLNSFNTLLSNEKYAWNKIINKYTLTRYSENKNEDGKNKRKYKNEKIYSKHFFSRHYWNGIFFYDKCVTTDEKHAYSTINRKWIMEKSIANKTNNKESANKTNIENNNFFFF